MITLELLQKMCPKTKQSILESYLEPLNTVAEYNEMTVNTKRVSGFLAQIAHESGSFTATIENLNYSAKGLMATFKKYFTTEEIAKRYERKPEMIGNRVYANRMQNGNEQSGDGYKFRGRGLIQLTGRDNYTKISKSLSMSLDDTVKYLETPNGATASAGWYWDTNDLNKYCDNDDFVTLTKRINGGTNGLEDRERLYQIALDYLGTH